MAGTQAYALARWPSPPPSVMRRNREYAAVRLTGPPSLISDRVAQLHRECRALGVAQVQVQLAQGILWTAAEGLEAKVWLVAQHARNRVSERRWLVAYVLVAVAATLAILLASVWSPSFV